MPEFVLNFRILVIGPLSLAKDFRIKVTKQKKLRKLLIRFFHERGSILEKYNQRDINLLLSKTLFI